MKKRERAGLLFFILIIFSIFSLFLISSISIASAAVVINEAEINPAGTDTTLNEWVELFNNGNEINISGWYIQSVNGNNYSLADIILGQNSFYIQQGFNPILGNNNQNLRLFDNTNSLIDQTGVFSDGASNSDTYRRVPDVTGNFVLQPATKNASNQPTTIQNKTSSPLCI